MALWRRVVTATDLSDAADVAISQGAEQACLFDARWTVVHVLPTWPGAPMTPEAIRQVLLRRERLAAEFLPAIGNRVTSLTGRDAGEFEVVVDDGLPSESILRRCELVDADLLVVGQTGGGGSAPPATRRLMGSVAEAVTRDCRRSVLVARASAPTNRLLAATDFSPRSWEALRAAAALQRRRGAELIVMHVLDETASFDDVARTRQRLRWAITELGVAAEPLAVTGTPAAAILRAADEQRADLVIVGGTGRSGLAGLLLGSVAAGVARLSPCPALIVRHDRPASSRRTPAMGTIAMAGAVPGLKSIT